VAVDETRDLRLVELLGALSLATDLGTGQPSMTGVRSAVLAAAVAGQLDLPGASAGEVLQVGLLRFLGCTADSAETARLAGGDDLAFRAAMAPATMGARPEMARRLMGAVGPDRPLHQRAAVIVGALLVRSAWRAMRTRTGDRAP